QIKQLLKRFYCVFSGQIMEKYNLSVKFDAKFSQCVQITIITFLINIAGLHPTNICDATATLHEKMLGRKVSSMPIIGLYFMCKIIFRHPIEKDQGPATFRENIKDAKILGI